MSLAFNFCCRRRDGWARVLCEEWRSSKCLDWIKAAQQNQDLFSLLWHRVFPLKQRGSCAEVIKSFFFNNFCKDFLSVYDMSWMFICFTWRVKYNAFKNLNYWHFSVFELIPGLLWSSCHITYIYRNTGIPLLLCAAMYFCDFFTPVSYPARSSQCKSIPQIHYVFLIPVVISFLFLHASVSQKLYLSALESVFHFVNCIRHLQ